MLRQKRSTLEICHHRSSPAPGCCSLFEERYIACRYHRRRRRSRRRRRLSRRERPRRFARRTRGKISRDGIETEKRARPESNADKIVDLARKSVTRRGCGDDKLVWPTARANEPCPVCWPSAERQRERERKGDARESSRGGGDERR